jgi:hypothetical protein
MSEDLVHEEVKRAHVPFKQIDDKIVPVIVSRMNPFTPGHVILLIEALLYAAKNNLQQVSIILSQSWDDDKNPVDPHTKQRMIYDAVERIKEYLINKNPELKQSIQQIQVVVELMGDYNALLHDDEVESKALSAQPTASKSPALNTLRYILDTYYKYPRKDLKVVVICGEDRGYEFFRESLGGLHPQVSFEEYKLERPGMQGLIDMSPSDLIRKLEADQISPSSMSASVVRKTAASGEEVLFSELMNGSFLSLEDLKEVYDTIIGLKKASIPGKSRVNKRTHDIGGTLKKVIKKPKKVTKKYKKYIKKTRKHKRKNTKRNKKK